MSDARADAPTRRVALFAKRPRAGAVKTRLSPALPARLACDLYAAMLADVADAAAGCGADGAFVYWADDVDPAAGGEGDLAGLAPRRQRGGDLGARLAAAFAELLARDGDRAVVIGADCPGVDAAALAGGFAELERHDLVLGPTLDGGYWLIGLGRPCPALFEGVEWSTERVLAQTLERAEAAGLRVVLLAKRADLDVPADVVALAVAAARGGMGRAGGALSAMGLAPATAARRGAPDGLPAR